MSISTDELWVEMNRRKLIAGPWIPEFGHMARYNFSGAIIAMATSEKEVAFEDARLVMLGYELTYKDMVIPQSMWDNLQEYRRSRDTKVD